MADAPAYRIWPPVALGMPLLAGLGLTAIGGPVALPLGISRAVAAVLIVAFVLWNASALWLMARSGTALLPGASTRTIIDRGPFAVSRNPLYLGLIALDVALALLWPSFWALAVALVGVVAFIGAGTAVAVAVDGQDAVMGAGPDPFTRSIGEGVLR